MKEEEANWAGINKRRSILLSQSDWTQLPDTGLTVDCVFAWRDWRHRVRSVNQENYGEILAAIVELEGFGNAKPDLDFSGHKYTFFERKEGSIYERKEGSVYERAELIAMVKDILEEIQSPEEVPETLEVPETKISLDQITDIKIAKKYVQKELEVSYRMQIKKASPPLESSQLYIERLNQAIDYLAGTGTAFPLLEVLSENLSKNIKDIAVNVLRRHTSMITTFTEIEDRYLKSLKIVEDSDRIEKLKEVLEVFNGY